MRQLQAVYMPNFLEKEKASMNNAKEIFKECGEKGRVLSGYERVACPHCSGSGKEG